MLFPLRNLRVLLPFLLFATTLRAQTLIVDTGLQPQLTITDNNQIHLVYATKDKDTLATTIWHTTSTDNATTFSPATKVATATSLPVGKRRGPRIAATKGTLVITAVVDKEILAWRSTDAGKSWSAPTKITDSPAAAREGFNALTADPNTGLLVSAWLDLRNNSMEVWSSRSTDAGQSWSKNTRVYASPAGHVCECCSLSVITGPHPDQVSVMFRNWDGANRDLYLATSTDAAQTFPRAEKLGTGSWKLDGCPMDGGSLAVVDSQLTTVWRRNSSLYLARPGETEHLLTKEGIQPVISQTGLIAWTTTRDGDLLLLHPGDLSPTPIAHATDPALCSSKDGKSTVLVWESAGKVWGKFIKIERNKL